MKSLTEKITELSKRRGFFFTSSEAYGGAAGFQTFGPEGAELKHRIEESWRKTFSQELGHREIEAPTIMPEPVFKASGHLDTFDDMIVVCPECEESVRADHLVEDNTEIEEAEGFSPEEIMDIISEQGLGCPSCGESLSDVKVDNFNLMFETSIGPGAGDPGYLRPETAQGIFVEFPRLKDYARNQLPFGITQIGKAYRNEISPRKGLVRVREFTQAELEHFIDPNEDTPDIESVKDVELTLYPVDKQGTGDYIQTTVEEAVKQEIVHEWVAYYLGIAKPWYEKIGIDMDRFRFRQHQDGERAHYATDCWDAEAEIDGDWIEIAGFAYRGCYDLDKHDKHSKEDFTIFKRYDKPKIAEEASVDPDMSYLGPEYGDKAGDISDKLSELAETNPEAFNSEAVDVKIDGETFTVPVDKTGFSFEEVKKNGEHILPHVIEPSFGVGRTVYTVLAHSYDEDRVDDEERTVLRLKDEVAPTEVAVFPLMDKDGLGEKAREIADSLRTSGFAVKYDETGNIGKRYRRQDEVGTPYCVTVDYETIEEKPETVTVRYRDSTEQERVEVSELQKFLS